MKGLFFMCDRQIETTTTLGAVLELISTIGLNCRDLTLTQNIYWLNGLSLPNCIRGFKIKEEAKSQRWCSRGDCHIEKRANGCEFCNIFT